MPTDVSRDECSSVLGPQRVIVGRIDHADVKPSYKHGSLEVRIPIPKRRPQR
jgi:hypothetical protein